MAQIVGLLLVVLFIGGTARFAAHVYQELKTEGVLPLPRVPKPARPNGKPSARARTQRARKQAVRGGRTVSVIAAEAITTNWLARKAHQREQAAKAPADSPPAHRPLLHRLVVPGGTQAPATPAAQPAKPVPHDPDPSPTSSGGTPMTTPATTGGTSAGDFMSATTRIIAEAEAGGLQSKARGALVMGEGLKQLAAAMDQHARHLQDVGQYPAYVWEPWRQASGMAAAAAAKTTEAGSALAELSRRPMGEANGQAPHRDELNQR